MIRSSCSPSDLYQSVIDKRKFERMGKNWPTPWTVYGRLVKRLDNDSYPQNPTSQIAKFT